MPVRILDTEQVTTLLPMDQCVDVMGRVLAALAEGRAAMPLRTILRLSRDRGLFGVMPAEVQDPDGFGVKVISVFPKNEGTPYDSHQGAVLLFEPDHGTLVAIMDASAMTAIRTAAVSGVATRLLAREDAGDLAILGTGMQARTHLEAMRVVRPIRRVRVWSRNDANRRAFVAWAGQRFGLEVEAFENAVDAVRDAEIICTVTSSRTPVLAGDWVAAGTHINAVGSSLPSARELDTRAMVRSRLFVDRRESARNEAGDFLIPRSEGAITDSHIRGELGELLLGQVPGRTGKDEVTLFKSLGLAVEDVAAAHLVWTEAERRNAGLSIELGGRRHDAS